MGGFEGADHCNSRGIPLDMAQLSGHAAQIELDHRRAAEAGFSVVRESVGWRLSEAGQGVIDTTRLLRTATSAREHGLQVIWTLMHYGTPADVSLFDEAVCGRLAHFAMTVAKALRPLRTRTPVYNVINEISFTAWAAARSNLLHPYRGEGSGVVGEAQGYAIKKRLIRATLAAIDAIRQVDSDARFLQIEPTIHVVPPRDRPDLHDAAELNASYQWQVWDMLCGRLEPELGGHDQALDLIGINHYHGGQWEHGSDERLWWHLRDRRRRTLLDTLRETWQRYSRPIIISETSHVGEGRAAWLNEVAHNAQAALAEELPLQGICLYPLVDRPDWENLEHWHRSGLWDVAVPSASSTPDDQTAPHLKRVLNLPYFAALRRWQAHLPEKKFLNEGPLMHLIVFSHLRWGFVYQRPQHLLSRLSQHFSVLFVEEPLATDGESYLDRSAQGPNLEVLVPHTRLKAAGFHDEQLPEISSLLNDYLRQERVTDYVVWLYTPLALPLLDNLAPKALIYDCMDELSAFLNAPVLLREREQQLLARANLVLTGGPALYEAKRGSNPDTHCVPSSVDVEHFCPAGLDFDCLEAQDVARLQEHIARPRLGFFGVIDERLDLELIRMLAEARSDWQLVVIGPVVKIDPQSLPRAPNIHWLGMQSYARLPYFLAGWDVCLLPFALNESTRFISPTKTLEYLAGEKPVVSTPVRDVVALYGAAVQVAAAGPAFVAACEQALLSQRREGSAQRSAAAAALLSKSSWDKSASLIHQLINAAVADHASAAGSSRTSKLQAGVRPIMIGGSRASLSVQPSRSRPDVEALSSPPSFSAARTTESSHGQDQ